MSVRQYVGARYVPKFFENPNGSAEWIKNTTYEPLTIVTYLGNSYTSKKPVPLNTEITNTEYWVLSSNFNEQLENINSDLSVINKLRYYVTPEMYGAVGDGVSDDRNAIISAISSNNIVVFPNKYYISAPIELKNDITLLGGYNYGYKVNINTKNGAFTISSGQRNIKISGFNFTSTGENEIFLNVVNDACRNIIIENVEINNYTLGINADTTLWDCEFNNFRINSKNNEDVAINFTAKNSFNINFTRAYINNGKIKISNCSCFFNTCNFGLFSQNQIIITGSSECTFITCNFECEEKMNSLNPIALKTGSFVFIGCTFVLWGDDNSFLLNGDSTTRLIKITGCVIGNKTTDNKMSVLPTNYLELAYAGALSVDSETYAMEYTGNYSKFSGIQPSGVNVGSDNGKYPNRSLRYNNALNEIQYTHDGTTWVDALGNANDNSNVIKIGNNKYIEFGVETITSDTHIIYFKRKIDGTIILSNPEISSGNPIAIRLDPEQRSANYCVIHASMWENNNKTWVGNTSSFKLYWAKISE